MNTTIWTGPGLPTKVENMRIAEIRADEQGTRVVLEYTRPTGRKNPDPRFHDACICEWLDFDEPCRAVIHPLPGQLGGDMGDQTEIKCGRCGHRFLVRGPISTTTSCPACGLNSGTA